MVQKGTGTTPMAEPGWYKYLNAVFSETHEDINLTSCANDLNFVDENRDEMSDGLHSADEVNGIDQSNDEESNTLAPDECVRPRRKKKLFLAPHKKGKVVHSNKQAQSQLARGVKAMADVQMKRHKESLEAEKLRFEMLLKDRKEEVCLKLD